MFEFYVGAEYITEPEEWTTLVHVCRRWRYIVFASPRRLNLQLLVKAKTPVRKMPDIWPALPIVISPEIGKADSLVEIADNVVAALEHPDRVCHVALNSISFRSSELERVLATMQNPFPVLRCLRLCWLSELPWELPSSWSPHLLKRQQSFPIHSWVDLLHFYGYLCCLTLSFRRYRNFFCPPITSSCSTYGTFRMPGTFLPKRWPLVYPL